MSVPTDIPTQAHTHRRPLRPTSRRPARLGKRTGFVLGVVAGCVVLAVAGNAPSARSEAPVAAPPEPGPVAIVHDFVSPLRGFLVDESVTREHAAILDRARAAAAAAPVLATLAEPKARASLRKEPTMRRACGYKPRIQQRPVLDAEQKRNAHTIIDLSQTLQLPPRAAVIGVATAFQESNLRNVNFGDRDSLGLFQQRPSMGWGTKKMVRTPTFSAAAFYVPLVQTPGWQRMPLTKAAQLIQRSAYPTRYAQWELAAATLVKERLKVADAKLNCSRR
jgi:hypothetical protein